VSRNKLIDAISDLTITEIKPEYVILAKLHDDGVEVTLGGDLLQEYLREPYPVDDVQVILDVETYLKDVGEVLSEVWAAVLT
jgi:hypothetical protein